MVKTSRRRPPYHIVVLIPFLLLSTWTRTLARQVCLQPLHWTIPHIFSFTEAEIGNILSGIEGDASFLNTPAPMDPKRNVKYESKRKITLELHLLALSKYYKAKRIPRGVRSQLRPNMFSSNVEFQNKFESLFNQYARDIIVLHMYFLHGELSATKKKMHDLDTALSKCLSTQEDTQHTETLNGASCARIPRGVVRFLWYSINVVKVALT